MSRKAGGSRSDRRQHFLLFTRVLYMLFSPGSWMPVRTTWRAGVGMPGNWAVLKSSEWDLQAIL